MINYQLDGKVALVTGAGGGIGRETSSIFARSGARVVVADVADEAGNQTVAEIKAMGGEAIYQRCDVSDAIQVRKLIAAAISRFGRLDCAFNNAGINRFADDQYDEDIWERDIGINLSGVMRCMREEAKVMLEQGGGAIVNTASMNGVRGNAAQPAYTASKHGIIGLTRHGALRWATANIRVNAVCPGVIGAGMTMPLVSDPRMKKIMDGMTPMGRMGTAAEVGEAVVWLCSSAASFVTGHAMLVDGGATA